VVLLLLALFWGGLLVLKLVGPMLGGDSPRSGLGARFLVPLAVVTVAGFIFDQYLHGRFL
jgi:hypothetical protein